MKWTRVLPFVAALTLALSACASSTLSTDTTTEETSATTDREATATTIDEATSTTVEAQGRAGTQAFRTEPTYESAVVDGISNEWNLSSDLFANMYQAGKPDKPVLSKLYIRYACDTETLYVLDDI